MGKGKRKKKKQRRICKDCKSGTRPAPRVGPRCVSCSRAVNKQRADARHATYVAKTYNLDPGDYAILLEAQGGVCALCRKPGVTKRLAVDHDHKAECILNGEHPDNQGCRGCVRGLIHGHENSVLGRWRDDPERFERAADYLRNPPAKGVLR